MPRWTVVGSYLARRDYWQTFTKEVEAVSESAAREVALSQLGGSHRVRRQLVRIASVRPGHA